MNDDLGSNKERLIQIASTAGVGDVLVDLGVRTGASSFAMLNGTSVQQCRVIGVDVAPCPFPVEGLERYEYIRKDSVSAASEFQDGLFIVFFDTLHIREQVMAELYHYWPKIRVGGWAVFHDTNWPQDKHDHYLARDWGQAVEGVNAFFADGAGHITREDYPDSWGMTFIQKLDDWNPVVPGMDYVLMASRQLTEMLME